MGYESLAAAVIQSAVEDYKDLQEFGLIKDDKLDLGRFDEFLVWLKARRRSTPGEVKPDMLLFEAYSAHKFFATKRLVQMADFCGVDAEAIREKLGVKRGHI